jgi:hypothetical protein
MALLFNRIGEQFALQYLVNLSTSPQNLLLHLFTNNYTPIENDAIGNYTEATGFGYAAVQLTGASWVYTAGDPSSIAYPQVTFTFSGALGNVYGYYLTRFTGGELIYEERFSNGPYNIQNNGDSIALTPKISAE